MFIRRIFLEFFGFEVDTDKEAGVNKKDSQRRNSWEKNRRNTFKEINPITEGSQKNKGDEKEKSKLKLIEEPTDYNKNNEPDNVLKPESTRSKPVKVLPIAPNDGFMLDIEKIFGKGEDAPPILRYFQDNSYLIGVADGMGGAGGTVYDIDNVKHSGAYLASRAVNSIAEKYIIDFKEAGHDINTRNYQTIAQDFKYHFDTGLNQILDKIHKRANSKLNLKSNLIKRLPTTFALSYIKVSNGITMFNYWAGDSRIYVLSPFTGLHQLTTDDLTNKGDAFENLINDSPLSNCIHADKNYRINFNYDNIETPVIIFSSTDGAFGYLPTPTHFEFFLLDILNESINLGEWKKNLEREFKKFQSDDISMSFIAVGFKGFLELKDAFYKRSVKLKKEIDQINAIDSELYRQEIVLNEANKAKQKITLKIEEYQGSIEKSNDQINSLNINLNSLEYDIKTAENSLIEKRKEIERIEDGLQNKRKEMSDLQNELEITESELMEQKNTLNRYRNDHKDEISEDTVGQLKLLNERKFKLKQDLWLRFKEQYENHLKP